MSAVTGASPVLTPQEDAYFSSGGTDLSAFEAPSNELAPAAGTPAPDASSSPAPAGTPAAPAIPGSTAAPAAPAAGVVPGADPSDDELINQFENDAIGDDGKPRSGGQFIRRENFRVISTKYKNTKAERDAIKAERDAQAAELATLRDQRARLDERLRLFNEALAQPAGQAAPAGGAAAVPTAPAAPAIPDTPPDPNTDPIGALSYVLQKLPQITGEVSKAQQAATATQNTLSDAESYQRTTTAFQNDVQRFVGAGTSDFMAAYQHGLNARAQMYAHSGITDRAEIQRRVREDERVVVENALKAGKSPAEAMYSLAQALGYRKAEAAPPTPAVPQPGSPPAAAAPAPSAPADPAVAAAPPAAAPAAPAEPSAVDEVARLAAAQNASKSLSTAGGGTPVLQMTIERLIAMNDSEFAAYERQNPGVVKTLMGG